MGAFGFLVILGSSMGCPGFCTPWTPCGRRHTIAKGCTESDFLNLLREASRCIPRSPEGISYSFKDII